MKVVEHNIMGEFITLEDLKKAYRNLLTGQVQDAYVEINDRAIAKQVTDCCLKPQENTKRIRSNKNNIYYMILAASALLGILFNFNIGNSAKWSCLFFMLCGVILIALNICTKSCEISKANEIRPVLLLVKVKSDRAMLQVKAILHKSNAVKIKLI